MSITQCFLFPGGKVTFNVDNDSPTLTAAKVTFTMDLQFPHNQKVQPDGDVVWAEDCTVNGNTHSNIHWPMHTVCFAMIATLVVLTEIIATTVIPRPQITST